MILDDLFRNLRQNKIKKLLKKDNCTICDLGCRDDFLLKSIKNRVKEGFIFDKYLEKKKEANITFDKMDLETDNIPLENESVDMVTMFAVLEHLNNPNKVVAESLRVLKPNGVFVMTTPSVYSKPVLEFLAFRLGIINKEDILDHKKYYTPKEIKELLKANNFKTEKIKINYFEFGLNIFIRAEK